MKLKLIQALKRGDREHWSTLALFEIIEGDDYKPAPPEAGRVDTVFDEVFEEIEEDFPPADKIVSMVAARLGISEERVRELRYWPEWEDWRSEVYSAAREAGVEFASEGSGVPGYAYAREPSIGYWTSGTAKFLTIEQTGGLDI